MDSEEPAMRVRDHVALSAVGAAASKPWFGPRLAGVLAGGVLIDADHYLWFCVHERRLDPSAAVRRFNEAHAPEQSATRAFHSPAALLGVLLLSGRKPRLRPVVAGMGLHVALDRFHEARMARSRAAALRRDDFTCQVCGTRGPHVETHVHRQPVLLPSYRPDNLISVCGLCHEAAHRGVGRWS
jgi:hypothetical protein